MLISAQPTDFLLHFVVNISLAKFIFQCNGIEM